MKTLKKTKKFSFLGRGVLIRRGESLTPSFIEREFKKYLESAGIKKFNFSKIEKKIFVRLSKRLRHWRRTGVTVTLVDYFESHRQVAERQGKPLYVAFLIYKFSYKIVLGGDSIDPEFITEFSDGVSSTKSYQQMLDYLVDIRNESEVEVLTLFPDLFPPDFVKRKIKGDKLYDKTKRH